MLLTGRNIVVTGKMKLFTFPPLHSQGHLKIMLMVGHQVVVAG